MLVADRPRRDAALADAGVVDQDVAGRPSAASSLGIAAIRRASWSRPGLHYDVVAPVAKRQRLHGLGLAALDDDDRRTGLDEGLGAAEPDGTAAAGHHGPLAVEVHSSRYDTLYPRLTLLSGSYTPVERRSRSVSLPEGGVLLDEADGAGLGLGLDRLGDLDLRRLAFLARDVREPASSST